MDVDAATLIQWLRDGGELAVLDAREQGVYFQSHLFHAACIPLSQLELVLPRSVPRQDTRVVWCDDGIPDVAGTTLAQRAAAKAQDLGWGNQHVLVGGTVGWMTVKLGLLVLLLVYHLFCKKLIRRLEMGELPMTSFQFRLFNEFPTLFLVAISFIVVLGKAGRLNYLYLILGIVGFVGLLMVGVRAYKRVRG